MADLRLAVDEAVTNVVIHGYKESDGIVELHMHAEGDAVFIRIRDHAANFDPSQVKTPQLDTELKDRPFGGMGIFLIRKMTDEAEFLPLAGGGNEIRLLNPSAVIMVLWRRRPKGGFSGKNQGKRRLASITSPALLGMNG